MLYTRHFLSTLKPKSLAKLARFPDLYDREKVRAARTFREFDNLVTAPLHGFRDTEHYWSAAACAPYLEHIRVPTLVLNARNDPFLPEQAARQSRATRRALRGARISAHRRPRRIPQRAVSRQPRLASPTSPRVSDRVNVPAEIFRTYDIRGVVGRSLTPELVREIGRALGSMGREPRRRRRSRSAATAASPDPSSSPRSPRG